MDQQTNRQVNTTASTQKAQGAQRPQSGASARAVRKKKKLLLLARLRGAMLLLCGMILLTGMLLVVLPMLRVKNIEVTGNQYYTAEDVIAQSNIKVGDELLALDLEDSWGRLISGLDYADHVVVRVKSLSTVVIEITEKSNVAYTAYNGSYYSFDSRFLVLEQGESADFFAAFPYVALPTVASITVGESIRFADEEDLTHVSIMMKMLSDEGLTPYVTLLDCAEKYSNAFVLNGVCRIEVGRADELESKLRLAQSIVVSKGIEEGQCAVVDVSNLQKSTFRYLSAGELLSNG